MELRSTIRLVSDGTVEWVDLTFEIHPEDDLHVYFDGDRVEQGWTLMQESTPQRVVFDEPIPDGVDVIIRRASDLSEVPHVFHYTGNIKGGAEFNAKNMDENFAKILRASEDAMDSFELVGINVEAALDADKSAAEAEASANLAADQAALALQRANAALASANSAAGSADTANTHANRAEDAYDAVAASASAAADAADAAATSESNAKDSEIIAQGHASGAAASASNALSYKQDAETARNQAQSHRDSARDARDEAQAARDTALQHQQAAESYKDEAANSATQAGISATEAENHKDLAYQWANAPKNQPVANGEFSAYHWAQKTKDAVEYNVVQELGDSDADVMSQKAVTDAIQVRWRIDEKLKPAFYQNFTYNNEPLDPRITFTRSGEATYIKNGRLLTAGVDEPVFEDGGLRLEPQGTNFLKESGRPSDSTVWGHHSVLLEDIDVSPYLDTEVIISAQSTVAGFYQQNVVDNTDARAFTFSCFGEVLPDAVGLNYIHIGRDHGGGQDRWYLTIDKESGEIESATVRDEFGSLVDYGSVQISGNVRFYWITVQPLAGADGEIRHRFSTNSTTPIGARVFRIGHQQLEKALYPTSYIPTNGQPATRPADNARIEGAAFSSIFNPNQGAMVFKIGEGSALPNLRDIAPYYAAALWTEDGNIVTSSAGGVYFRDSASGFWSEVGVKAPNKTRHNNAINHNIYPGDTIGISWAGNTINLFVNGVKRGDFTHEDVGEALQAVERFHIHDDQAMYLDTLSLFDTIPTDEQMEALTNA